MKTKRLIPFLIAWLLPFSAVAAAAPPLRVLASFSPMHIFTLNVVGDTPGVSVEMMLPASLGCPHDYALTASDMRKIAGADLFIANGMGMETFLDAVVRKANPRIRVIETSSSVKPLRAPDEKEHAAHANEGANPHTWVSPKNAILQVRAIEKALSDASPQNRETFRANADAYAARIELLDHEYRDASAKFRKRNIVTFHSAFDYMAQEYGLSVVGRIEDDLSAARMRALLRTIKEKDVPAVFAAPENKERIIDIIAREAKIPVVRLDPVAAGPASPTAYEDAMRRNLKNLTEKLSSHE